MQEQKQWSWQMGNIWLFGSVNIWPERKLKKQLAFMKKHDVAFSCTAYEQIDENGKVLNKIIRTVSKGCYNRVLLDCPGRKFYGYVQRRKDGEI